MPRIDPEEVLLRIADHALPAMGVGLLLLGVTALPPALTPGWAFLALAFFAWVAEADGLAVPRPGRAPIRVYGCWETPLAFTVRHGGGQLLFSREEDPGGGGWSSEYTVRERAACAGVDPCWELPLGPASGWSVRGRTPVADLRFEHHERVCYVTRGSLERALTRKALT
jgi:hypothetical protein